MATRGQVVELLDLGHGYETAAGGPDIPAGLALTLATGLPAHGSDAPTRQVLAGERVPPGSFPHLVDPPAFNPTRKAHLMAWVRERAARDLQKQAR